MKKLTLISLLILICTSGFGAGKTYSMFNGKMEVTINVGETVTYSVTANRVQVLAPSRISMTLSGGKVLGQSPKVKKVVRKTISEQIDAPLYRQASFSTSYQMLDLQFSGNYGIEFRLYQDGIAYRFHTSFDNDFEVKSEQVEYVFAEDFDAAVTYTSKSKDPYQSSFETQYEFEKVSACSGHTTFAYPPLYINAGKAGRFLITESDVEQYPGMFLKAGEGLSYVAEHPGYPATFYKDSANARYPKTRENFIAKVQGTRTFPWRILIYGKDDVALANNNMVYQTASPSRVADTSWIKGGHAAWDWWNGIRISNVDFVAGINTETYKYYVDFAARYGIENVLIDDGWYSYKDHNLLKSVPEVDIPEIVAYAKSRGVNIHLWAVGNTFEEQIEEVCAYYSKLGVKGFKVDFFDRQDQEFVESVYHMAEVTAKYGLTIDYHGMYKPTGLSRTFPNVVNYEGVFGLEQLKWTDGTKADMPLHDVMLPFTRGAVGPLDYTPGAMINATKDNFRAVDQSPMSQGTRAHQIALFAIFDSPFVTLCDNLTNYIRESESTEFIVSIPAVPDELKVLQGEAGKYVVSARRKGNDWFIGGITTWEPRDVEVDLSFLGEGSWKATIFKDGVNADRIGEDYRIEKTSVSAGDKIKLHCAPGGGFVIRLTK